MSLNILEMALEQMSVSFTGAMMEKLEAYRKMVLEWNEKVNMTAIVEQSEFEVKHYVDSVAIASSPQLEGANMICDIGTGAGFPGVPLAILFPEKQFFLMDSLNKRINILREICECLSIGNVKLYHGRAEELARQKDHRERYDLCVSRAVANLAVLSEYCLPFVKVEGWFAPYKTKECFQEVEEAHHAIELLGGSLEKIEPFEMDGIDLNHQILWIKKINQTVPKYPRKAGTPAKDPLK